VATNYLCATGTAAQVLYGDAGQPDWGAEWGVVLGWNLNQPSWLDGGTASPADLTGMTSITVGLIGATGLNLRVQLDVRDMDSGMSVPYCAILPSTGGTIPLSSLMMQCWSGTGSAFNPATMQPVDLAIQVVTDTVQAYPFSFCVTALSIR
jgi:hypothetical protein